MANKINALIVANPGRFRDGLQTVMQLMPNVLSVACADSVTAVPPHAPISLILLDADLAGASCWPTPDDLRQNFPLARLLLLVSVRSQEYLADSLCADAVLLKGFYTDTLTRTIDVLVASPPMPASLTDVKRAKP
ncbi:MAG: hypothetical protein KBE23_08800 [Chloroflexi bacterium]|nr:hypothetical protein [Chloroflexota bacterium]MBP7042831.1 hypothetical protein [Chloroflexota bacterium]